MFTGGFIGHLVGDHIFTGSLKRILLGTGNTNYYSNVESNVFAGFNTFLKEDVTVYNPVVSPQSIGNEDEDSAAIFAYPVTVNIDDLKDTSMGLEINRAQNSIGPDEFVKYPVKFPKPFFSDYFVRTNKHFPGRKF